MSTVEEVLNGQEMNALLNSMADSQAEPHIVINTDRSIIMPSELRVIAVQHDHNIKTVTFDCPRYWYGHDISALQIYVNFFRPDGKTGRYPVDNVRVDDTNTDLIHFDWTITKYFSLVKGSPKFLVCACSTDDQGNEELHWNSFLNSELSIAEGLECTNDISEMYPDEITSILTRIEALEKRGGGVGGDASTLNGETADDIKSEVMSSTLAAINNALSDAKESGEFKGDPGEQGPQGIQGIQGEQGPKGDKGDTGEQGIQGIQGPKGDKGDTGEQGPKGDKGDTGAAGASPIIEMSGVDDGTILRVINPDGGEEEVLIRDGKDGAKGLDGLSAFQVAEQQGFEGTAAEWLDSLKGDDGADGASGATFTPIVNDAGDLSWENDKDLPNPNSVNIKGPKGDKGDTGAQGEQGIQGPKGDKGDTGESGSAGKDGTSVTVSSVSESSVDGGSNIINFSDGKSIAIKNGNTGSKGDKGDTGEQGIQGIQGIQGPKGDKGDTGAQGIQGPKGDPGPAGADGKTPVKGMDYFTEADKAEMVSKVTSSLDGVPDYWQAALDEGAEAINTALCNAGRNKSAFLFYSDTHWNYGSGMAPALLKHLYQHTGMNKTFFGGDIVNDEAADYDTMEYLWDWRRQLKGLPNHHSVPGNHDDGNSTNNLFSEEYVYGYLLTSEETPDMVCGDKGLYYYVDNPAEKTRYLCLDTGFKDASALSDDQREFIKASLKSVPAGWHIVVVAHIWYGLDYDQYDKRPVPVAGLSATASSVLAILDNYNSRNGEFSECGGWVEFCIGGHIHYDYDAASATGIPIILVETDSHHTRGRYTATVGTATESAVSGIVADYSAHKIHVIRIGRGANREVEVTNYVVSYTNVLPRALAADGVSVYNADDTPGYKANTRWSSSSNAEGSSTGTYITGWIPAKAGDVIRLKNITMPHVSGNTCMIHYFNNSFTTAYENIGVNSGFTVENYAIVKDENNNVVQFTIPANAPFTHIRIQCGGIDDTSIITINEPIE